MKMKKLLAAVLSALMLVSLLAACGGSPSSNSQAPSEEPSQPTEGGSKTYQFWGTYEESGANASMLNAAFLLNLNGDGTAVADKYMFANFDASDAATNPTFTASYMSGTWKEVEKDGVACLQIKLAYVDEAGTESNAQTAYAYDVAGVYSFDLTFPVVPGMSYTRVASMEGKEGQTYADANAFIQAYKQEFTAPESVGTFTDADNNGTVYLQADGTALSPSPWAARAWTSPWTGIRPPSPPSETWAMATPPATRSSARTSPPCPPLRLPPTAARNPLRRVSPPTRPAAWCWCCWTTPT